MNKKIFSVIYCILLTSAIGFADAESVHLTNVQLDTVTAGAEGTIFRESYSSSKVTQNENDTAN